MAGIDKSTARAIAVIALLFVTAWALRGYLPGSEPVADRQRPQSSPAALVVDVALLSISVAIIGYRDHRAVAQSSRRGAQDAGSVTRGPGHHGAPDVALLADRARRGHRVAAARDAAERGWACTVQGISHRRDRRPSRTRAALRPPPIRCRGNRIRRTTRVPNVVGYLVPPMLILMALIVVGTAVASRRRRSRRDIVGRPTVNFPKLPLSQARRNHSRGQPKSAWPRSVTSAANRARRSSRVTPRWSAN